MAEQSHHRKAEVATNRPSYREARRERAVKVKCRSLNTHPKESFQLFKFPQVYTINQESKYLLVQNVHALGVTQELLQQFSLYGDIQE